MSTSKDNSTEDSVDAASIEEHSLENELEQSYIEYAMSVIVRRALPDVRDGLKPVQRRILYKMSEQGVSSNSEHRKSSSVIGETMGDYHPHGDASIYSTLVRMAQDFSMRVPLIDGQGNFGSIDGDPAAAMRYTESRLSRNAELLLDDLDKNTVTLSDNYDGRLEEPDVLPAAFPNLLVNGSEGIAVGVSTKIPPHNPGEIIDATIECINNPDATTDDLMEYVQGPDFPTGGKVIGTEGIRKAYDTGRGKLTVRGEYHFESVEGGQDNIIITEIPFQDRNRKSDLVDNIAQLAKEDEIEGIKDLRDESDTGIRIVIETKQSAIPEVVANKVVDNVLERTFGVIQLALVDGQPRILSLKELLEYYIQHRQEVITRRTRFKLDKAEDRSHILEGRLKAMNHVDDVVEIIQDSEDRDTAKLELREEYEFSSEQAEHIVRMQLGSLTSMEAEDIEVEYENLQEDISQYNEILGSRDELNRVVKQELREVREELDTERRTDIVTDKTSLTMTRRDFIPEKEQILIHTENDYIKRVDTEEITEYSRGSKGLNGINLRDGDRIKNVMQVNSHETAYIITETGTIYSKDVFSLPEQSRTSRGTPIVNILDIDKEESIESIFTCKDITEYESIVFVTENAKVKRTNTDAYTNIYASGIQGIGLEEGDSVVSAFVCDGTENSIMLQSKHGKIIRFDSSEVRETGRTTKGVGGIKLKENDVVVSGMCVTENTQIAVLTENGFGKRTTESAFNTQARNGAGTSGINMCERNGDVVDALVIPEQELENSSVLVSNTNGKVLRFPSEQISESGRRTKGSKIIETGSGSGQSISLYTEDE